MLQRMRRAAEFNIFNAIGLAIRAAWLNLLAGLFVLLNLVVLNLAIAAPAHAMTQLPISKIGYKDCPAEVGDGSVTSDGSARPANCYLIYGTVNNPTSKYIYDADVFGRVYDSTHNSVMENRTRLGGIPEVPPGDSQFSIRITVPASQPAPLQLEQFKASGFGSAVRNQLIEPDYFDDEDLEFDF